MILLCRVIGRAISEFGRPLIILRLKSGSGPSVAISLPSSEAVDFRAWGCAALRWCGLVFGVRGFSRLLPFALPVGITPAKLLWLLSYIITLASAGFSLGVSYLGTS